MAKIGDRVEFYNGYNPGSNGVISDIFYYADHGVTYYYFDGNDRNTVEGWEDNTFRVICVEDLIAWKANAIARFPKLAEPETDAEAAARFTSGMVYSNDIDISAQRIGRIVLDAIKWARSQ